MPNVRLLKNPLPIFISSNKLGQLLHLIIRNLITKINQLFRIGFKSMSFLMILQSLAEAHLIIRHRHQPRQLRLPNQVPIRKPLLKPVQLIIQHPPRIIARLQLSHRTLQRRPLLILTKQVVQPPRLLTLVKQVPQPLQQQRPMIKELIKHRPRILQQRRRTTRPKRLGLIKTVINPQRLRIRLMIRLQLALTMMPPRLTHRIRQATNLIKMRLTTRTKPLTQPQPMIRTRPLLKTLMQLLISQRQPLPRIQPIHRQQPIKPLR